MSYSYPFSRMKEPARRRFQSRAEYLAERARAAGASRMLCQVMESAAKRVSPPRPISIREDWFGFPWLTSVLGSGSLEMPQNPILSSRALAQSVGNQLDIWLERFQPSGDDWPDGGESLASVGEAFALALARNRLRVPDKSISASEGEASADVSVDASAAGLVLAAALLTRFYHWACSTSPHAESRWDDDNATYDIRLGDLGTRDLDDAVLRPLKLVLKQVQVDLAAQKRDTAANEKTHIDDAVAVVLEEVESKLQGTVPTLSSRHLHIVTEIAWHFLTKGSTIYPGWTDLLLSVMLREGADVRGTRSIKPMVTNLHTLPEIVTELIKPVTDTSWATRTAESGLNASDCRVSQGVAEVLWAQSQAIIEDVRQRRRSKFPPAVSFVTSFDVELEMALSQSAHEQSYFVVLPVHLRRPEHPYEAELFWLMGEVPPLSNGSPDEQLAEMLRPTRWRLLTAQTAKEDCMRGPLVVHLSGSPLHELPDIRAGRISEDLESDFKRLRVDLTDGSIIIHAVVVEEYLAMRHAEAELFWSSSESNEGKFRFSRALPEFLISDGEENPRFWLAMGVAIADPAVRHRVVSQMTVRRVRNASVADPTARNSSSSLPLDDDYDKVADVEETNQIGTGSSKETAATLLRTDVEGVAVNMRVDDDEAMLLYWLGIDVVESDCQDFVEDLQHYAVHVRAPGPEKHAPLDERCPLLGRNA